MRAGPQRQQRGDRGGAGERGGRGEDPAPGQGRRAVEQLRQRGPEREGPDEHAEGEAAAAIEPRRHQPHPDRVDAREREAGEEAQRDRGGQPVRGDREQQRHERAHPGGHADQQRRPDEVREVRDGGEDRAGDEAQLHGGGEPAGLLRGDPPVLAQRRDDGRHREPQRHRQDLDERDEGELAAGHVSREAWSIRGARRGAQARPERSSVAGRGEVGGERAVLAHGLDGGRDRGRPPPRAPGGERRGRGGGAPGGRRRARRPARARARRARGRAGRRRGRPWTGRPPGRSSRRTWCTPAGAASRRSSATWLSTALWAKDHAALAARLRGELVGQPGVAGVEQAVEPRAALRLPTCANAFVEPVQRERDRRGVEVAAGVEALGLAVGLRREEERAVGDAAQLALRPAPRAGRPARAPRRGPAGARGRRRDPAGGPPARPAPARPSRSCTRSCAGVALEPAEPRGVGPRAAAPASAAVSAPATVACVEQRAQRGRRGARRARARTARR